VEGVGIDFDAPLFDTAIIDEVIPVTDDEAFAMLKALAKKGFLVGPSSGAVAAAVHNYLPKLKKEDLAVMIFGDSGRAYLSKGYYS
jgi:cysteine synthase